MLRSEECWSSLAGNHSNSLSHCSLLPLIIGTKPSSSSQGPGGQQDQPLQLGNNPLLCLNNFSYNWIGAQPFRIKALRSGEGYLFSPVTLDSVDHSPRNVDCMYMNDGGDWNTSNLLSWIWNNWGQSPGVCLRFTFSTFVGLAFLIWFCILKVFSSKNWESWFSWTSLNLTDWVELDCDQVEEIFSTNKCCSCLQDQYTITNILNWLFIDEQDPFLFPPSCWYCLVQRVSVGQAVQTVSIEHYSSLSPFNRAHPHHSHCPQQLGSKEWDLAGSKWIVSRDEGGLW